MVAAICLQSSAMHDAILRPQDLKYYQFWQQKWILHTQKHISSILNCPNRLNINENRYFAEKIISTRVNKVMWLIYIALWSYICPLVIYTALWSYILPSGHIYCPLAIYLPSGHISALWPYICPLSYIYCPLSYIYCPLHNISRGADTEYILAIIR